MTWKTTNTAKGDNKLYSDAKGVVPSLDLRFAEGKNLNDYMTGQNLITFSRPVGANQSPGTYVDENGIIQLSSADQPRFDHDPTTGESLGLLIEESRTNLLTYSSNHQQDITHNFLNGFTSTVHTKVTNIDPPVEGDEVWIIENQGSNDFAIKSDDSTQSGYVSYTIFLKRYDSDTVNIKSHFGGIVGTFNLVNGTFTNGGYGVQMLPYSNGWYKIIWTRDYSSQSRQTGITIEPNSSAGVYVSGTQIEVGPFPTSYIPTTTTALTRSADAASITGSNFSSWYNQSEGTVFGEFSQYAPGGKVFTISDNTAVNFITVQTNSIVQKAASANVFVSSSNIGRIDSVAAFVANSTIKFAHGVSNGYRALSAQGETAVTAANPPTLPVVDTMYLGANDSGVATFSNGTISRLTYFPDRLPDAILQAITAS